MESTSSYGNGQLAVDRDNPRGRVALKGFALSKPALASPEASSTVPEGSEPPMRPAAGHQLMFLAGGIAVMLVTGAVTVLVPTQL
jgi:hypothetical protein